MGDRDVLSLQQAENGAIFAGTNHGIFYLASLSGSWLPATHDSRDRFPSGSRNQSQLPNRFLRRRGSQRRPSAAARKKPPLTAKKKEPVEVPIPIAIAPRVRSIQITDKAWYAATNEGLFISVDGGKKWYGTPVEGESDFVAANDYPDGTMTLASIKRAFLSRDGGRTWSEVTVPTYVTGIYNFTMTPDSSLWLGTREGAIRSTDGGKDWAHVMSGLPPSYVLGVKYDAKAQRLLATAMNSRGVFESVDGGKTWHQTPEANFSIRTAMGYQDLLLAISWHNGLLLQRGDSTASLPRMLPDAVGSAAAKSQQ